MRRVWRARPVLVLGVAVSLAGCSGQQPFAGPFALASSETLSDERPATIGNALPVVDLKAQAKDAFRRRDFGLAEKGFQGAVEKTPGDLEALIGLAATHDMLGRYDLADREYALILKQGGPSAQFYNNRGYSYMLRGDDARARRDFLAARRLEPDNAFVASNLRLLDKRAAGRV